jgi:hypothetical protein
MSKTDISFDHFLERFPEVKLPLTLGEDSHHDFSRSNEPLNKLMIQQYILPLDDGPVDEYTEFIACVRIPETYEFHAIIYWKAGLMTYQYSLVTFTKKGLLIDKRVIAGTFSDGKMLTKSMATIDEDWIIYVVSGQASSSKSAYDASSSTAYKLELLPDGKIINII